MHQLKILFTSLFGKVFFANPQKTYRWQWKKMLRGRRHSFWNVHRFRWISFIFGGGGGLNSCNASRFRRIFFEDFWVASFTIQLCRKDSRLICQCIYIVLACPCHSLEGWNMFCQSYLNSPDKKLPLKPFLQPPWGKSATASFSYHKIQNKRSDVWLPPDRSLHRYASQFCNTRVNICVYIYIYICILICSLKSRYIYIYAYVHVCIYLSTSKCIYIYIFISKWATKHKKNLYFPLFCLVNRDPYNGLS